MTKQIIPALRELMLKQADKGPFNHTPAVLTSEVPQLLKEIDNAVLAAGFDWADATRTWNAADEKAKVATIEEGMEIGNNLLRLGVCGADGNVQDTAS